MENHTAKHFVLQLSSLISLYLSLSFLVVLAFGIINILYPDAANGYWETESAIESVRIGIAVLLVFFPTYLILTRTVNKSRRQNTGGMYLSFTKWLIYLSLLVSGLVLLGDLVTVIMTFLNGEITERFILKAITVLVVVGAAFYYYILDARAYWMEHEKKSVYFAGIASVIVLATVVFGFTKIDAPAAVREQKLDELQINDLRMIQSNVQQYYVLNKTLPDSLEQIGEFGTIPTAPEGRSAYRYNKIENGFELCATFAQASRDDGRFSEFSMPIDKTAVILNPENWQHKEGDTCFRRAIGELPN
ncbi:MAG TPA: DUF5671 domain-containing protein [Candidatus Paceibacterota bacterium]